MPKKRAQNNGENFRTFVRDLGVRAFDQLASGATGKARGKGGPTKTEKRPGAMTRFATYWSGMTPTEKEQFFDQVISAAQDVVAEEPAPDHTETASSSAKKKSGSRKRTSPSSSKRRAK